MTGQADPMATIRAGFFVECVERVDQLHDALSELEAGADLHDGAAQETVNTAFRAVHSIKGGAASFGLDALVRFSHAFETGLKPLRNGTLPATPDRLALIRQAADHLADLVLACAEGSDPPQSGDVIAAQLLSCDLDSATPQPDNRPWRVRFRPRNALYASGNEPFFALRSLHDMGAIRVKCDRSAMPDLDRLDPVTAYLGWIIDLPHSVSRAEIGATFDFVADVCDLDIMHVDARPASALVDADQPHSAE